MSVKKGPFGIAIAHNGYSSQWQKISWGRFFFVHTETLLPNLANARVCQTLHPAYQTESTQTQPEAKAGKMAFCESSQALYHYKQKKKSLFQEKWKPLLDLSSIISGQLRENLHKKHPHKILLAHCSATKTQTPLNFAWQNTYYCSDNRSDRENLQP